MPVKRTVAGRFRDMLRRATPSPGPIDLAPASPRFAYYDKRSPPKSTRYDNPLEESKEDPMCKSE